MARDRAHDARESSEDVRDRQVMEVLQELRVAITGGQILFAFLLTVPFSQRWADTTDLQQKLYLITLLSIGTSTGCFIAPTAAHRLRFHQRDRSFVVAYANGTAIAGLVFLMIAMLTVVMLVTDFIFSRTTAIISTAALAVVLLGLWFAVPLARYGRDD